ncbi:MAG: LPS assembly lipoprotein LptE [Desulfovibrio sp.]
MRHFTRLFFCSILLCVLMSCSGYKQAGEAPIVLNTDERTLAFGEIDNPTLETWLVPEIRSAMRNELNNRGWVTWKSRNSAKTILEIDIVRYTDNANLKGTNDQTLRYASSITAQARLISRIDKTILWRTPEISESQSWYSGEQSAANTKMVKELVRRIAELMEENY